MADIRIKDLPKDGAPSPTDYVAIDGTLTRATSISDLVDVARPYSTQAQAEAGTDNSTTMTPLRVSQAIAAAGGGGGGGGGGGSSNVLTVNTTGELQAAQTTGAKVALFTDNRGQWNWRSGNFTAQVAADPSQTTYIASNVTSPAAGCWVRVTPFVPKEIADRGIRFDQYRAVAASDQAALVAMVADAFSTTKINNAGNTIDLCGMTITQSEPIDVSVVSGRTTNFKNITFTNGTIVIDTSNASNWANTVRNMQATVTQYSDVVTVASTSNLEVGMCMLGTSEAAITYGDGVARESYITEIINATSVRLNTYAYRSQTRFYNFVKFPYMFNFSKFTTASRVKFTDLNIRGADAASFVQMGQNGIDWAFDNIYMLGVRDRLITDFGRCCSGCVFSRITAWSSDNTETRKSIGITATDNDAKFEYNRVINFLHSQVMHAGGYNVVGCHNWQGGNTVYTRQAAFVHTNPTCFATYTGNYIDNGGIEISTENVGGATLTPFQDMTITGNVFTHSERATIDSRYIILTILAYGSNTGQRGIAGLNVSNNVFRKLTGSGGTGAIPRVEKVQTFGNSSAQLNYSAITGLYWSGNTYRNITRGVSNPYTETKTQSSSANYTYYLDGKLPFSITPGQVLSVVPGGMSGTPSNVKPSFSTSRATGDPANVNVWFSQAITGDVTATFDVNR